MNIRDIMEALVRGKSLSYTGMSPISRNRTLDGVHFNMYGDLINNSGNCVGPTFSQPSKWTVDKDHKVEMYESVEAIAKAVANMQKLLK